MGLFKKLRGEKKKTYRVTTQSGSIYEIEIIKQGEWLLRGKGTGLLPKFINAIGNTLVHEKEGLTNADRGKNIIFFEHSNKDRTVTFGNTSPIVNIEEI